METASGRISVGGVLSEAFRTYGQNAATLLLSAAAVFVVVGVIQGLLQTSDSVILLILASIVGIVGFSLYTGFVVRLVEDVRDGRRDYTVGELFRSVGDVLASLVGNSILRAIAIGIGFFLLVIPGLILITIWAVTSPAIVVERRGPVEAFGRSWELVRGDAWNVFGVLVVVFLLVVAVVVITGLIASGVGAGGSIVVAAIGNVIVAPAFALASAVLYFDLRGPAPAGPTPPAAPAAEGPPPGAPPPP